MLMGSLLLSMALAAQAGAAPQKPGPNPEARVPFADGETATYDVSWSAMTAGTAKISVRAVRGASGIDAWSARAETTPSSMLTSLYSLSYLAESTFDARTLLPRRGLVDSREGSRRRIRTTAFDHAQRKARYSVTIGDTVSRDISLAPESQDLLSFVYKVRSLPLSAGFKAIIPVSDNGHTYSVEVVVSEKSVISTPLGALPAWKISPRLTLDDGKVDPGQRTLWFSADDRRILLRAESELPVGRVILALASFLPGKS